MRHCNPERFRYQVQFLLLRTEDTFLRKVRAQSGLYWIAALGP
jgi:hypothetical protein